MCVCKQEIKTGFDLKNVNILKMVWYAGFVSKTDIDIALPAFAPQLGTRHLVKDKGKQYYF